MNDDRIQGKQLAWAVLSKAKGSQLSQVIKVTNHIEADETVAAQPDTLYKSGPFYICLLYTSPSPRDMRRSRMPSSA